MLSWQERAIIDSIYEKMRLDAYEFWQNYTPKPLPCAYGPKAQDPTDRLYNVGSYVKSLEKIRRLTDLDHMLLVQGLEYLKSSHPTNLQELDRVNSILLERTYPEPAIDYKTLRFISIKPDAHWKHMLSRDSDLLHKDKMAERFLLRAIKDTVSSDFERQKMTLQKIREQYTAQRRISEHYRVWHKAANTVAHFETYSGGKFDISSLAPFLMSIRSSDRKELDFENKKKMIYPKVMTWTQIRRGISIDENTFDKRHEMPAYYKMARPVEWTFRQRREMIRRKTGYFRTLDSKHDIYVGLYDDRHIVAMYDSPMATPYFVRVIVGDSQRALDELVSQIRQSLRYAEVKLGLDKGHDAIIRY